METVLPTARHEQTTIPYFKGFLDEIRSNKDRIEQIVESISYVEGESEAVRKKLEYGFYAAIMAQRDAILAEDEETQEIAKGVSLLAFYEGYNNKYLPAYEYPKQMRKGGYVSGEELKVLQVKKMLSTLQDIIKNPDEDEEDKAEAALRLEAVNRYADVTQLTDIIQAEGGDEDTKKGNIFARNSDKVKSFGRRMVAAAGLSTLALIGVANTSHAAQKSPVDDESYDPDDKTHQGKPRFAKPIRLAPPANDNIEPPIVVKPSPESAKKSDGSVKLAIPADNEIKPPVRVEASPNATIIPIPNAPIQPPKPPAHAIEKAPTSKPIPEVIIDPGLAGETLWTAGQLEQVRANFGVYHEVQKETGVPWEVMAALHVREFGLQRVNPANGQGIYQLYSTGIYFAPGPVSDEGFKQQTLLAANFLLGKAQDNRRVGGPMNFSNPNKIKDALFAYNGLAPQYFQQAARLGYTLGAEGSPYVMNMADDKRNSDLNSGWGQILVDNGPLGKANKAPGAWPLIEGLQKINKIARDRLAAQYAAETKQEPPAREEQLIGWPTTGKGAMELFKQCDPRWGNILSPNGMRVCDISCGPTSIAMAVKMLKPELNITPKETIEFANANRMWFTPPGRPADSGGVTFDGMIQLANKWGVKGNQMGPKSIKNFEAYKQIIRDGGVIIAAGSGPTPFVDPSVGAHFVLIRGVTEDGKFLVADPYPKTPDTNEVPWDANQIINSTFGAVVLYN